MPEGKSATSKNGHAKNKKGKHRYLPHNKPVKKGLYPLRPGVEGFFITCDGGRERQATHEAINLLDTFYEELVEGGVSATKTTTLSKPLNKVIKFSDSDSSESEDETHASETEDPQTQNLSDRAEEKDKEVETTEKHSNETTVKEELHEDGEPPAKKQCREPCQPKSATAASGDTVSLSIDKQIEAELKELGDRTKRHFVGLDSGCNGCIFIQMNKRVGDPGPAAIVHHMMKSAASTKKHMSRFILRVLPVEITCYASEEEITKAIEPLISQYFSAEAQTPQKFAVLYEARANTGIDRMKIINSVAKSVPQPHKVDLSNPDKTIVVQIAKTICMIGVVEGYKELAKYNLRQLTSK